MNENPHTSTNESGKSEDRRVVHVSRTTTPALDDKGVQRVDSKGRPLIEVTSHSHRNDENGFVRAALLEVRNQLGRDLTKRERREWARHAKRRWKSRTSGAKADTVGVEAAVRAASREKLELALEGRESEIRADLAGCSRRGLLALAKGGVVPGYSKMTTEDLRDALFDALMRPIRDAHARELSACCDE